MLQITAPLLLDLANQLIATSPQTVLFQRIIQALQGAAHALNATPPPAVAPIPAPAPVVVPTTPLTPLQEPAKHSLAVLLELLAEGRSATEGAFLTGLADQIARNGVPAPAAS